MNTPINAAGISAILTDIEGTTSSLTFVKDVLFPYARSHIADFIRTHAGDEAITMVLDEARNIAGDANMDNEALIEQFIQWIDQDRKITPLKSLQGLIWETGYREGDFHGHIYPDALEFLRKWRSQGMSIYVYSSGSVYAQKLLFGHTTEGDITDLFDGYFDTHVGAKTDKSSYEQIAQLTNIEAARFLFLSDIEKELDAAAQAGMQTCWLVREGELDGNAAHLQVADFSAVPV